MKVENKFFIDGKEVNLAADKGATKIYVDDTTAYIVNWDEVVAITNYDVLRILEP